MTLFWIGMGLFLFGVILRNVFKYRMYKEYNNAPGLPDLRKKEINAKYRPMIFVALGIEIIGIIVEVIYIWRG